MKIAAEYTSPIDGSTNILFKCKKVKYDQKHLIDLKRRIKFWSDTESYITYVNDFKEGDLKINPFGLYKMSEDRIYIKRRKNFKLGYTDKEVREVYGYTDKKSHAYLAVLLHEIAHSTGHVLRLKRSIYPRKYLGKKYCKEELVADFFVLFYFYSIGVYGLVASINNIGATCTRLKELKVSRKQIEIMTLEAAKDAKEALTYFMKETTIPLKYLKNK